MRTPVLPRLIPGPHRLCLRCCRLPPRRTFKSERQVIKASEEAFVQKATSTPASTLLTAPARDNAAYDANPAIKFRSPSLAALHARIGLPAAVPLSTLRRCLRDPSIETDHAAHNEALSVLGSGLLEYYVAEYLCVRWPRLPMSTQLSALWAYTGESALARVAREWGVKSRIVMAGVADREERDAELVVATPGTAEEKATRPYVEARLDYEVKEQVKAGWIEGRHRKTGGFGNKVQDEDYEKRFVLFAMQRFVQSLVGGVLVHSGMQTTQNFIKAHILSRALPPLSTLHIPINPFQELTTLCERLKIPLPISRLIAESGRRSRTPLFVVGVYSGREKLGEGQGRSLKEAKTRACINGLRAWYLYEQAGWEGAVPSRTEGGEAYVLGYVDPGSVII